MTLGTLHLEMAAQKWPACLTVVEVDHVPVWPRYKHVGSTLVLLMARGTVVRAFEIPAVVAFLCSDAGRERLMAFEASASLHPSFAVTRVAVCYPGGVLMGVGELSRGKNIGRPGTIVEPADKTAQDSHKTM